MRRAPRRRGAAGLRHATLLGRSRRCEGDIEERPLLLADGERSPVWSLEDQDPTVPTCLRDCSNQRTQNHDGRAWQARVVGNHLDQVAEVGLEEDTDELKLTIVVGLDVLPIIPDVRGHQAANRRGRWAGFGHNVKLAVSFCCFFLRHIHNDPTTSHRNHPSPNVDVITLP